MKKNTMMRVASALLVAVLLTTCAISGTFAKYVSSAETSDTARVARWGWGSTDIQIDLFDGEYDGTVDSENGDNVIAPGTSKTGTLSWVAADSFKPEVDYELTFAVDATIPADIEAELDWTLSLDGGSTTQNYTTFEALEAALEAHEIAGEASTAAPTINVQIGWVWAFNGGDDVADTTLGDVDTLAELSISVTMTATQVN